MTAYEHFCENGSVEFENEEFYFRRDEIENMIGAKIPYIENLSDVENVKLASLQDLLIQRYLSMMLIYQKE